MNALHFTEFIICWPDRLMRLDTGPRVVAFKLFKLFEHHPLSNALCQGYILGKMIVASKHCRLIEAMHI